LHYCSKALFGKSDGQVIYFNGHMPVFSHAEDDIQTFRMIASQFCVGCYVKQSDIIRTFGVTSISVKRSVKTYRRERASGLLRSARNGRPGTSVLMERRAVQRMERRGAEEVAVLYVDGHVRVYHGNVKQLPQSLYRA
jgi:prepilin-type processing-associated H-X9-DG protein